MTIDSVEAAGDPTDIFENWEDRYENVIWNGREITILDQQRTDQFIEKAQAIIQSLNEEKKHRALVHHVKQLSSLEERAFDFAPVEHEFILINSQLSESEIIQCGLFKRVWDGMRKGAKKAAKAFKKVIDAVKKAAEEVAHGTKKAAEKVADFVKEHKKETLIAAAIIAAIAGAFIISGALSGGAAATGGGTPPKRKEDEKDDKTSPPSDPPPLPDWVSELLKSTTPDFSPDKLTEASLDNAKKEAHNAWNLFNNLKSDTENGLTSLKKFEPEFNPSSHAVNTILNTVLEDPQKYEFSKNLISSQSWTDIIKSGHEQIDHAFITLLSGIQTAIPPPPPPKPSPTFLDKIRLGLEIIGRGMMEPELLDPNSPLDLFIKDNNFPVEAPNQTVGGFLENIINTFKSEQKSFQSLIATSKMQQVTTPNDSTSILRLDKTDIPSFEVKKGVSSTELKSR